MYDNIAVGMKMVDTSSGVKVTVTDKPRRVAGGWAVDVKSTLWNGATYFWTANAANLRKDK